MPKTFYVIYKLEDKATKVIFFDWFIVDHINIIDYPRQNHSLLILKEKVFTDEARFNSSWNTRKEWGK